MSLKYVFQTEFRTVLSNPNTSFTSDYDTQLGSVGYLDESFNGFESDFTITDLEYKDENNNVVDRLEVGKVTTVEFNLLSIDSVMLFTSPVVVGHTSLVDSSEYGNSKDSYNDVWTNETLRNSASEDPIDGTLITNFDIIQFSGSRLLTLFHDRR